MRIGIVLVGMLVMWLLPATGFGQQARETFGKNRLQFKTFDWYYVSSDNFDIHYYGKRLSVAKEVSVFLEKEFERITRVLGSTPLQKTKIFLYASISDLQQSNRDLNHVKFWPGGETVFVKPNVEIAHPGSLVEFKEQLLYKVTDLLINEMMFGGNIKDMFKKAVLLNLSEWFLEGIAYYVAKGWSEEMDDYVRQIVKKNKVKKALRFTGKEAALVGQSIWNFIAEKYGPSNISSILNYSRIIRNEENAIQATLGVSFRSFMNDWALFYSKGADELKAYYKSPADSQQFTSLHRQTVTYTTVKFSPDGKYLAYAENDRGKYTVFVHSLETGRSIKILNGGLKVIGQDWDKRVPLLSWANPTTLGVIGLKNGAYVFWLYDLQSQTKVARELSNFSNVQSFSISPSGRLMAVSADAGGINDLYLLSTRTARVRRITNDSFDDIDPAFLPGSNTIVFASNRTTNAVSSKRLPLEQMKHNDFNLYAFDLDTSTVAVHPLTRTISVDTQPVGIDNENILYLSDQRGIMNLFRFNIKSGIYSQLTNYDTGIKAFHYNATTKRLALVMTNDLLDQIILHNPFVIRQVFTPPSNRKNVEQLRQLIERKSKQAPSEGISIKDLINKKAQEHENDGEEDDQDKGDAFGGNIASVVVPVDTLPNNVINTENYTFEVEEKTQPKEEIVVQKEPESDAQISTEDFTFEDEQPAVQSEGTFLERFRKARESDPLKGPFKFNPRVSYDNLITSMAVDPIRGLMQRIETQLNDELENYRLYGGLQFRIANIKSGDVFLEFQYLPKLIDYSVRFDRRVYLWDSKNTSDFGRREEKYAYQKLEFGAALPVSVRTRIAFNPFISLTHYQDMGEKNQSLPPEYMDPQTQFYAGAKAEIVYDNSLTTGLNIREGTRGKIAIVHHHGMGNSSKGFTQVHADLRHYQKLIGEVVLAARGLAGAFFGPSPKHYIVGGVDTWFSRNFSYSGANHPLVSPDGQFNDELVFTEFATNLRGFQYATLYGNKVLLGNVELRIPLLSTLSSGPISSNFFKNLQLIGFWDIGTAWSGAAPFGTENSVRDRVVPEIEGNSAFKVVINEFTNPWIYSYGFGLRSVVLGHFLWANYAWPVENHVTKDPTISVGIGLDF